MADRCEQSALLAIGMLGSLLRLERLTARRLQPPHAQRLGEGGAELGHLPRRLVSGNAWAEQLAIDELWLLFLMTGA